MTDTAAAEPSDRFAHVLASFERQEAILLQLSELTRRQALVIDQGQPEELLALLAQRGELVEHLRQANAALDPMRPGWDAWLALLPREQRQKLADLADRIGALREGIVQRDQDDCQRLRAAQSRVGGELQRLGQGNRAAHSYRAAARVAQSAYTDRQG